MATYSEYLDKIRNMKLTFLNEIPAGLSYCSIKHSGAQVCNVILKDNRYCVDNTSFRELCPIVVYICLDYLKHKTLSILNSQD